MKSITFSPPWQHTDPLPVKTGTAPTAEVVRCAGIPVVIAEDDAVSRELVSSLVDKWGFRSIVTQNGNEAMAALRAEKGAAIALLDWMMPGMDGLQVCRRVRESGQTIYIILLTARGAKESIVEGLRAGADDYLVKPYDKEELFARIQVGLRILDLHISLAKRVAEVEEAMAENQRLKHGIPL
jgi:phosphoserine phosphatase RsbU/P